MLIKRLAWDSWLRLTMKTNCWLLWLHAAQLASRRAHPYLAAAKLHYTLPYTLPENEEEL